MSEPSLPSPAFEFRPARDADRAFLFQVYATSREAELSVVPWTLETKNLFLRQQFEAQDHHYRSHYPGAEFLVIEREGRSVGRLYLHRSPNDLLVMDIALLPAEQRQGIGGRILSDLAAAADTEQRSMSLHVEPQNPALRLYQRLGFRVEEDVGVYVRMVRPPGGIS